MTETSPKPAEAPKAAAKPAEPVKEAPKPAEKPAEETAKPKPKTEDKVEETPELDLGPPETISDEELEKLEAKHGGTPSDNDEPHAATALQESSKQYNGAAARVGSFIDQLADKKDEFTIYGYGGKIITLGDLRHLIAPYRLANIRD